MDYHVFNIGAPSTTAWWREHLTRGVITAGWEGDPGDRGEVILRDMAAGDWVLAYASGHGYIGAGIVGSEDTYLLHPAIPPQSESVHQHERAVRWIYVVQSLDQAVTATQAGRQAPRQAKERERNVAVAEHIIALLAERAATLSGETKASKRDRVLEAIRTIGRPCSVREITQWLEAHYNDVWTDVTDILAGLLITDANRRPGSLARQDLFADSAVVVDALIRVEVRGGRDVRFWFYDFATDGPAPYSDTADLGPTGEEAGTRLDLTARYWQVLEAVHALGQPSSIKDITAWLEANHPEVRHPDVRQNAAMLTVNEPLRPTFDAGRKSYRTDRGHPKDVLFRQGDRTTGVTYQIYSVAQHGVWDLRPSAEGKWQAVKLDLGPAEQALAEARAEVYSEPLPDFTGEPEARRFEMRAIALREGQPQFKAALLDAYAGKCAVTSCAVQAILEGAHIVPYATGGVASNIVTNGLLLRSDIHTLFDRGLLWIDAAGFVQFGPELEGSEYLPLRGRKLRLPEHPNDHPHPDHLAHHRVHTAGRTS